MEKTLRAILAHLKSKVFTTAHRRDIHVVMITLIGLGLYMESHLADWLFLVLALTFEAPDA